ncbi:MAG: methyltransferase domain-containing protein [Bacteroidetes bacterium]|nr:methyltransferase domain-containing protein [Bacteroidota bacterium]
MQKEYWDKRWQNQQTGWDVGHISTPLKDYFDQLTDKKLKILIPGCGNAYEAEYLWEQGFHNTFIVEISELAVASFLKRYPGFPKEHIFTTDFFKLEGQFDLVVEQTFFCAIDPKLRTAYAQKVAQLLKPGGKLVGVLFNRDFEGGPPFGGWRDEYIQTFNPYFELKVIETAYNSIPPRAGTELFIKFLKK